MTDNNAFERFVADHLADDGSGNAQAERIAALIDDRTGERRQWPRWLALIKEPPMRTNNHLAVGSPAVRVATIIAVTMLLTVALLTVGIAGSRLLAADDAIVVAQDGSGDFTTIEAAVEAAEDGDQILVRPGTYSEAVMVDKDITVSGDGPVEDIVVTPPEDGPVYDTRYSWMGEEPYAVALVESDGKLSGLTLSGVPARVFVDGGAPLLTDLVFDNVGEEYTGSAVTAALVINGGSTATVRDSIFRMGGGIDVFEQSEPLIVANTLTTGSGIFGDFGDGMIIRGNQLSGPGDYGIAMSEPAKALIEGNTIVGKQNGIRGIAGAPRIEGNTITRSERVGILVFSGEATLRDNTLDDNGVAVAWGAGDGIIDGNVVSGGATGIVITGGSPVVSGNAVEGAENYGISVGRGASPTLSDNVICGGSESLRLAEGSQATVDGTNEICEDAPAE